MQCLLHNRIFELPTNWESRELGIFEWYLQLEREYRAQKEGKFRFFFFDDFIFPSQLLIIRNKDGCREIEDSQRRNCFL